MRLDEIRAVNSVSVTILAAFALVIGALTTGGEIPLDSGTSLILSTLAVIVLITIYVRLEELAGGSKKR